MAPVSFRFLPALLLAPMLAFAQASPPAAVPPAPAGDVNAVSSMSWLYGCWGGTVNQRNFREQWMPIRGNTMIGIGSTVFQDKLQSFEYLRIEARPDGVFYVALPSGQKEAAFKLSSITTEDGATLFTFANPEHDFPQRIIYRRATEGWLYATIEGKYNGKDQQVIYPMRRLDCESGDLIRE